MACDHYFTTPTQKTPNPKLCANDCPVYYMMRDGLYIDAHCCEKTKDINKQTNKQTGMTYKPHNLKISLFFSCWI